MATTPDPACPGVTLFGSIIKSGGATGENGPLKHYDLHTMVYHNTTRKNISFTVRIYLKHGKRWQNFPSIINGNICVAGKVCGWVQGIKRLAISAYDICFLPSTPASGLPSPQTPSSTTRPIQTPESPWTRRARILDRDISTPSRKRPRQTDKHGEKKAEPTNDDWPQSPGTMSPICVDNEQEEQQTTVTGNFNINQMREP